MRVETIENQRVSLNDLDRFSAQRRNVSAVVLGVLNLGTVVIDSVAPAQHFAGLAWLLPGAWVRVRAIRRRDEPTERGAFVYADAVIQWIDWPGVYLEVGGAVWTSRGG